MISMITIYGCDLWCIFMVMIYDVYLWLWYLIVITVYIIDDWRWYTVDDVNRFFIMMYIYIHVFWACRFCVERVDVRLFFTFCSLWIILKLGQKMESIFQIQGNTSLASSKFLAFWWSTGLTLTLSMYIYIYIIMYCVLYIYSFGNQTWQWPTPHWVWCFPHWVWFFPI